MYFVISIEGETDDWMDSNIVYKDDEGKMDSPRHLTGECDNQVAPISSSGTITFPWVLSPLVFLSSPRHLTTSPLHHFATSPRP
jgi:hypothetical protein